MNFAGKTGCLSESHKLALGGSIPSPAPSFGRWGISNLCSRVAPGDNDSLRAVEADAEDCLAPSVESSRPILSVLGVQAKIQVKAAGKLIGGSNPSTLKSFRRPHEVTTTPAVRSWDASESHRQPAGKI